MTRRSFHIAVLVTLVLCSCSGLKFAAPEKPLFADFEVQWEGAPVEYRKRITEKLAAVVRPQPNNKVLGMRPTVALYNAIKTPKKPKGLSNWLKNKIGSAPVYLADVPLKDINAAFENRLHNHGYFGAHSRYEVETEGRTARVVFIVNAGTPHRLRTIVYADGSDTLNAHILNAVSGSPLKGGQLYDLAMLDAERSRVAGALRNEGWYHLADDDLLFAADTSMGGHAMDVRLRVKKDVPALQRQRYTLGAVRVHGDYDPLLPPNDSVLIDSVTYINYLNNYRPSTITRGVFIKPGQFYSARRTEQTSTYLGSYGVFKSTRVQHTEDSLRPGVLFTDVLLVPQKRWSLFTELSASSKSNNFVGPGMSVGFKDRNLFRGAELLTVDANGRFETQIAGAQKGTNAYGLGLKASLRIPRIVPFRSLRSVRSSTPSTRVEAGYGYYRRVGLYGVETFNTSLGYVWRQNRRVWHDVRLPEVSYSSLVYTSPEFDAFLDSNATVERSFEEQFIIGVGYTYTVSTQQRGASSGYVLINLGFDESGSLPGGMFKLSGPRPEEGYTILDKPFSQFVRFQPELRYYGHKGRNGGQLVARVMPSLALPYGNSDVVPYAKQFFVGGTNSVRAFRARSVGPGTYTAEPNSNVLIDQTGEIRFEANLEYRFNIAGYFKGAVFGDAGNIWLVNDDPQRPGGKFSWDTALSELAVGAGFGLRFDPEIIVVRLDLATPLRVPSLPAGDRWTFNDQQSELLDNVIFNIAIGYPF